MRVLITGGARRLGRAMARSWAERGAQVCVHYHHSLEAARSLAEEYPGKIQLIQADLSSAEGCDTLCRAVDALGALDLLINSAAGYQQQRLEDIDAPSWDQMMSLNARAPLLLTRGLLPALRRSQAQPGPSVINLLDVCWDRPILHYASYGASKAALVYLTRSLALELAPRVRVNGIAPGAVLAPDDCPPERVAALLESVPLASMGRPEDICQAMDYLVSARYVTGQILAVDGGWATGGPALSL